MGRLYVTKVEKELFKSIYIDEVYIHIGTFKIKKSNAGIYNQLCDYFDSKKKLPQFILWLTNEYSATDQLTEDEIAAWEQKIILSAKSSIYTEMLRIERNPDFGYTFYAFKNKGMELGYLSNMSAHQHYTKAIINFLKYDPLTTKMCDEKSLEHPMDKSNVEIKKEIDICLRYNLIPMVDTVYTISNTKDKYCIGYYDLSSGNAKNATPAWDSFIATIKEEGAKKCFKAWVYSVFKDENFGRQMLWLSGGGDTGKSKVINALKVRMEKINPSLVATLTPTEFQDKYSSSTYIKKRLIIAQDITDRRLVKNGLVKNITGNDDITVRGMGKAERGANVYGKLIVSCNKLPWVNQTSTEEISRLLLININPELAYAQKKEWNITRQEEWHTSLISEIDDFIAKCEDDYYECLNADGHNIAHYPEMPIILNSTSFVATNLVVWFKHCLQPFVPSKKKKQKLTNVIFLDDLITDFKRFMGKRGQNPRYDYQIILMIRPFLLEKVGTIYEFEDVSGSEHIIGYEFIAPAPLLRATIDDVLSEKVDKMNKDGIITGEIYATRKDDQKQGWKAGKNTSDT